MTEELTEGTGKEKDDERPRADGGVCGHEVYNNAYEDMSTCVLDRGHEGDHMPE